MCRLLDKTRELLRETKLSIARISVDTGVSIYTINRLKQGKQQSMPAVDTCEKLYVYLSGKELEL